MVGLVILILLVLACAPEKKFLPELPAPKPKLEKPVPKTIPPPSGERERLKETPCYALIPNHNLADYDRVNIIFVGFDVNQKEFIDFLPALVDYGGAGYTTTIPHDFKIHTESGEIIRLPPGSRQTFYGLLGTEPFVRNKNKFNFWYVAEIQEVTIPTDPSKQQIASCAVRCRSNIEDTCGLKNVFTANICPAECTPIGSEWSNELFIGGLNPQQIRIFVHEFAHSFGAIRDEYTTPGGTDRPGYPNCAPSLEVAQRWWGDLIGQGEGLLKVGFFEGCSYAPENIRPTDSSLMSASPFLSLGAVNERYIQELLDFFSGEAAARVEEKDMAQLWEELERRRR